MLSPTLIWFGKSQSLVVGGGLVTDVAGLPVRLTAVARIIRVPTTLIGLVDAGVIKVAVNHG